ncbi:MAG: hypothetical protein K9J27_09925 [Bacteroidales bacterium]|nr:hypothetical protein [Bacteroidales bacterium]MCF8334037.1 hypothetical protein [Bacteroidales bacterium]
MTDRHLTEEEIAIYAEAFKSGAKKKVPKHIRNHVKECNRCAEEVVAVEQAISQLDENNSSRSKSRKLTAVFWVPVAAGVTLLIGIGGYLLFYNQPDTSPVESREPVAAVDTISSGEKKPAADTFKMQDQKQETEKQEAREPSEVSSPSLQDKNLLAEAYKPHPALENLSSRFEKGEMRGSRFEIEVDNLIKVNARDTIVLRWKNPAEKELSLEVLDNQGNKVEEKTTTKETVRLKDDFDKGLYYWKLVDSDFNLLFCGKLRVE